MSYTIAALRESIAFGERALMLDRGMGFPGSSHFEAMLEAARERLAQLEADAPVERYLSEDEGEKANEP